MGSQDSEKKAKAGSAEEASKMLDKVNAKMLALGTGKETNAKVKELRNSAGDLIEQRDKFNQQEKKQQWWWHFDGDLKSRELYQSPGERGLFHSILARIGLISQRMEAEEPIKLNLVTPYYTINPQLFMQPST